MNWLTNFVKPKLSALVRNRKEASEPQHRQNIARINNQAEKENITTTIQSKIVVLQFVIFVAYTLQDNNALHRNMPSLPLLSSDNI